MSKKLLRVCIDPGHGMSNKVNRKYDSGAVFEGHKEEVIVMKCANVLREILRARGHYVVRTRVDDTDPAPVSRRDDIAFSYRCDIMVSLHCNWGPSTRGGTEVFYRGAEDKAFAQKMSAAVSKALGTVDRGAKTEQDSQHTSLAVLDFPPCWLVEWAFLDHPGDRAKLLNDSLMRKACEALADVIESF